MAAEKTATAWSNKKEDYELRDVIGTFLIKSSLPVEV